MGKEKNKNIASFTIFLIVLIIFISIFYVFFIPNINSSRNEKTLDTIYSTIPLDNGGTSASIDVTLNFEIQNKYSKKELQSATERVLQNLSYDDITGNNSISYLQETISNGLNKIYPDIEGNIDVYVTDFKMGFIADLKEEKDDSDKREAIYKGLFKNIKD